MDGFFGDILARRLLSHRCCAPLKRTRHKCLPNHISRSFSTWVNGPHKRYMYNSQCVYCQPFTFLFKLSHFSHTVFIDLAFQISLIFGFILFQLQLIQCFRDILSFWLMHLYQYLLLNLKRFINTTLSALSLWETFYSQFVNFLSHFDYLTLQAYHLIRLHSLLVQPTVPNTTLLPKQLSKGVGTGADGTWHCFSSLSRGHCGLIIDDGITRGAAVEVHNNGAETNRPM